MNFIKNNIVTLTIGILICIGLYTYTNYNSTKNSKTSFATNAPQDLKAQEDCKKLQDQLETSRIEKLKLQTELDSCKFTIPKFQLPEVVITSKKKMHKRKAKVRTDYQSKYDSLVTVVNESRAKCADMEIKLTEEINYKKKQIDTLVYVVNAYDKQLNTAIDELTKSNNKADSLHKVLTTPIAKEEALPCIKAKRGVMVDVYVDSTRVPKVKVVPYSKQEYKKLKGQCKKVTMR